MYVVICLREKDGKDIPIPIMESDDEDMPGDSMALWETLEEAQEFCSEHILCRASQNIIVDIDTGDGLIV